MTSDDDLRATVELGHALSSDLAEFGAPAPKPEADPPEAEAEPPPLAPDDALLADFDWRVTNAELRAATRSLFVTKHYAEAVENGVKALCECIRSRTKSTLDGDPLMTETFSTTKPKLALNSLRSQTEINEQRGHMMICQGIVAAWRNPRAHSLLDDEPTRALMMLETIDDLITTTKGAARKRARKR